jgi:MFS family permease
MLILALSVTSILSSTEATIISTALPTIVHNLNVGSNYAWIVNAYFLTWQANSSLSVAIADQLCEA